MSTQDAEGSSTEKSAALHGGRLSVFTLADQLTEAGYRPLTALGSLTKLLSYQKSQAGPEDTSYSERSNLDIPAGFNGKCTITSSTEHG